MRVQERFESVNEFHVLKEKIRSKGNPYPIIPIHEQLDILQIDFGIELQLVSRPITCRYS